MHPKMAAVVTAPYYAKETIGIEIALRELLHFRVGRVILVHDAKGSSRKHVEVAAQKLKAEFEAAGIGLEILPVDEGETTSRWYRGVQRAFDDPTIEVAFVFAGDFAREPTPAARKGWGKMIKLASRKSLTLGDYSAIRGSFKDNFERLVEQGVEALFPLEIEKLRKLGLRRCRTEFFCLGRDVLDEHIAVHHSLRERLKTAFEALVRGVDENLPPDPASKDPYQTWREKLLEIAGETDPARLDQVLCDGRRKYDPETLEPRPFDGLSLIHNVDAGHSEAIGFAQIVECLKGMLRETGNLDRKIAFVDAQFVHATIFDLINRGDHEATLREHGYDYETVRQGVQEAALRWLRETGLTVKAAVRIVRVGMFAPGVIKLDLEFHPTASDAFQALRLALHKSLSAVPGYCWVRSAGWNQRLAGHLTIGYLMKPFDKEEVERFLAALKSLNDGFTAVPLELTQGEVTEFSNMDHYRPVTGGTAGAERPASDFKPWGAGRYAAQARLLAELSASPERRLDGLLELMRQENEPVLYFCGTRIDHPYCLGSRDLGVAISVLPGDGDKAAEPGYHPGSTEIYVVFQGSLVLEQMVDGHFRTASVGQFGVAVIPPGRCHRVRREGDRPAASLIVKTNPHHKPGVVRCDKCIYGSGQLGGCELYQSWKQEQ